MSNARLPTKTFNVVRTVALAWFACAATSACVDHNDHLPYYQLGDSDVLPATPRESCATPSEGCPCATPGAVVDCGDVIKQSGDSVTCSRGARLCGDQRTWGACVGDTVLSLPAPKNGKTTLGLGMAESCAATNPCDPLCRQFVDTGVGLSVLPDGFCSTATGISLCPLCGYSGPVGDIAYARFPAEWQTAPLVCSSSADHCPIDMVCVDKTCQARAVPCAATDPACAVDLTLGKPCFDPASPAETYHVPLCNRGSVELSRGTIIIEVDHRKESMTSCAPLADSSGAKLSPSSGTITFALTDGRTIPAGTCVDVNPTNSVASELDLSGHRALVASLEGGIDECNPCNNGTVALADPVTGTYSTCTECFNLDCHQSNPLTTLRGVVYDPGGRHPLPNVLVFIPNGAVAPFVDGVACDSCDSLVSGSPIVHTTTDATGHFTLSHAPSDVEFPLVVQSGRWRRQFTVIDRLPAGQTRWVVSEDSRPNQLRLNADPSEPEPYPEPSQRLRLAATQRRCVGTDCAGEGDIPLTAVLVGDGDPVQCALRKIGISDAEFVSRGERGRMQLFPASGMQVNASIPAYGYGGITSVYDGSALALFDYSLLLGSCNAAHSVVGMYGSTAYEDSPHGSGPSYNAWPNPSLSSQERANVKSFVDAGGRLLTTHWLSMDLVHLNYSPPTRAKFSSWSTPVPLDSPYDPNADADFAAIAADYAATAPNFLWRYVDVTSYAPNAPAVFLFGSNVGAGSNTRDARPSWAGESYPNANYQIDTSTTLGATFAAWAATVGAGVSSVSWQDWSPMVRAVHPDHGVVTLLAGDSRDPSFFGESPASGGTPVAEQPCLQNTGDGYDCGNGQTWGAPHVGLFQFDTPLDAANKCGRVAVAAGHVSRPACYTPSNMRGDAYCENTPGDGNPAPDCGCYSFPHDADLACGSATSEMTPEELSFEYLLFGATQCLGELTAPPPQANLSENVFVRDFEADCAMGELPVWQLFSWQAAIPTGAQIAFTAATADAKEELGAAHEVAVGLATSTTATWTAADHTLDQFLRSDPGQPDSSRQWLRIRATFTPIRGLSPTLSAWRLPFDCVPSE